MFSIDKDPSAKLDYVFDWTDWLHKTEVKEGALFKKLACVFLMEQYQKITLSLEII